MWLRKPKPTQPKRARNEIKVQLDWLKTTKQNPTQSPQNEGLQTIACNASRYTSEEVLAQWNLSDDFLSRISDVRISDIPLSVFPNSVEINYTYANKRESSVIFMDKE